MVFSLMPANETMEVDVGPPSQLDLLMEMGFLQRCRVTDRLSPCFLMMVAKV